MIRWPHRTQRRSEPSSPRTWPGTPQVPGRQSCTCWTIPAPTSTKGRPQCNAPSHHSRADFKTIWPRRAGSRTVRASRRADLSLPRGRIRRHAEPLSPARAAAAALPSLTVPRMSSTSCDLGIFVDDPAEAIAPSDPDLSRVAGSGSGLSGAACWSVRCGLYRLTGSATPTPPDCAKAAPTPDWGYR
jgi:hypothetical protein